MFGNKNSSDSRIVRFVGDMALVSRLGLSLKEVKSLKEKERAKYLWYFYCEDRKNEQKRLELEMRSR